MPNGIILSWAESYGAYSYEYCVSSGLPCSTWVNVGTATTAVVPALAFETIYTWQVRAVNTSSTTVADNGVSWTFTTLDTFSKLLPVNGATNQKTRLTLTWEKLGTSNYAYCIDQTAPGTATAETDDCGTGWVSTSTATKVTLRLAYATTYYWQVRATNSDDVMSYANAGETPEWWSFTTQSKNTPSKNVSFEKISPQDKATDVATTTTLKWINVGATKYEYCLSTTAYVAGDICDTGWESTGTATSVTIESLTYPTTYYWQVRATIDGVLTYADKGAFWEFTTEYNKLSPVDHADGLLATNTKLDWQDVPGATEFEYCLAKSEYCNTWVSTGTTSEVTLTSLAYATTYYWQVRATVDGVLIYADGDNSAYWRFTTEELVKVSPVSGAIDQPINLTLDWGEVSGEDIAYEYCLYSDVVCTEWVSTAESSTAALTNLSYSTTYYWQVRANVGTVDVPVWLYADGGTFWNFTTIADPIVP